MESLAARRARLMGPDVPTFHDEPVHIVRGEGVWLWDAQGRRYLDAYNNVAHVGHCHPRVVEAIARQAAQLNTHTRYLHAAVLDCLERLADSLGHGIGQGIMVCTGSEANDVALRMARAATGRTGIIATDATYHGNTAAVSALSTRRPPLGGRPDHVRLVPAPDALVAAGSPCEEAPMRFAAHVAQAVDELDAAGHGLAGMMFCPFFANEGFPALAPGFLDPAAAVIRRAGGILMADEVQPGFGRLGSHFWGHERLGIVPDVVTMGKPMANGHPVAAVMACAEVMAAFRGQFGYFNTYGGNPVSAMACLATLDVLEAEGLQASAAEVGAHALRRLRDLGHPRLAGIRGAGLFFGADVVDADGAPAPARARAVVEAMRRRGVLINRTGRHDHTLKVRPPMPFSNAHADLLVDHLAGALDDTGAGRHD